ncbi:hypothetical protein TD95_004900 [Thielaviopsis punctulata]|uniref:Cross-pathway control protein 1 n=1 Tax=Thielaviopsis punctulata TaxID=72032 RepID=A0A0F4Z7U1_9PEZI|nr:hypothetical protein TD95_004900 [Thielaviopsis punctulata]
MDFVSIDINDLALLQGVFSPAQDTASGLSNMGTVSPQDLVISDSFSAPGSAALTTMTTPSLYDGSPLFDASPSFDGSPNFGTAEFDACSSWFPLFPIEGATGKDVKIESIPSALGLPISPPSVSISPVAVAVSPPTVGVEAATPARRKLSTAQGGRHSASAGVNAHRRTKPLPPIVVEDPSDTVAMKRARNTLAARKSRERKAQRLEDLEERIIELEKDRDHWKQLYMSMCGSH